MEKQTPFNEEGFTSQSVFRPTRLYGMEHQPPSVVSWGILALFSPEIQHTNEIYQSTEYRKDEISSRSKGVSRGVSFPSKSG